MTKAPLPPRTTSRRSQTSSREAAVPGRDLLLPLRSADMLPREEEVKLATAWREREDVEARNKLILAYIHLAYKMASKGSRYGTPMQDLVQVAVMGLMTAADRFEPERGFRFSTYAQWWIRAAIQDIVLRDHSMVRISGTTGKRAFFALRRVYETIEKELTAKGEIVTREIQRKLASERMNIPIGEIELIEEHIMRPDTSLNSPLSQEDDQSSEIIDLLGGDETNPEVIMSRTTEEDRAVAVMDAVIATLSEREQIIIRERKMNPDDNEPVTLEELAGRFGITRERVRQLEARALQKIQIRLKRSFGIDSVSQIFSD